MWRTHSHSYMRMEKFIAKEPQMIFIYICIRRSCSAHRRYDMDNQDTLVHSQANAYILGIYTSVTRQLIQHSIHSRWNCETVCCTMLLSGNNTFIYERLSEYGEKWLLLHQAYFCIKDGPQRERQPLRQQWQYVAVVWSIQQPYNFPSDMIFGA